MAVKAFHQLGGALVAYLRANLRCDEDAYDLAQDVYLRIARHNNVSQIQSLRAFVFTIATNLLRDKSRRGATKLAASSVSADNVALAAIYGDPLEQIEAEQCWQRIELIVEELRPACREAYLLSRNHSFSYTAIAKHMGISVSMVEKHISTALSVVRSVCPIN